MAKIYYFPGEINIPKLLSDQWFFKFWQNSMHHFPFDFL